MESTVLSMIAVVLALIIGVALIVLYKRQVIDSELIEGTANLMKEIELPELPVDSVFGKILEYAKTAVLTVEQLVKTGVINRDDESRKTKAMEIVETAAKVDQLDFGCDEEEIASACIEAEVSQLPRNKKDPPFAEE